MAIVLGDQPCVDSRQLARECRDRGLPLDWLGKANLFANPLAKGLPDPLSVDDSDDIAPIGRGALLMRFGDFQSLDVNADNTLIFTGTTADNSYTLQNITVLRATALTPGSATDPNAVFLVDIADRRFHLNRIPINTAYNVYSEDGSGYLSATLDSGSPWTWQQIVNDLATKLGLPTGDFALPFTPDGTPQNLTYWGGTCWSALCDLLSRIACAAFYSPQSDTFTVVRLGAADPAADVAVSSNVGNRIWDDYADDPVRTWRPQFVRVMFIWTPRPTDGTSPYYTIDVSLPMQAGVVSGSYVQLVDDEVALGSWLVAPTNHAALVSRANERANDWLRKRSVYELRFRQVYRDFDPEIMQDGLGSENGLATLNDNGEMRSLMRTELEGRPDGLLEKWQSLSRLAPWFPPSDNSITGTYVSAINCINGIQFVTTVTAGVSKTVAAGCCTCTSEGCCTGLPGGLYLHIASVGALWPTSALAPVEFALDGSPIMWFGDSPCVQVGNYIFQLQWTVACNPGGPNNNGAYVVYGNLITYDCCGNLICAGGDTEIADFGANASLVCGGSGGPVNGTFQLGGPILSINEENTTNKDCHTGVFPNCFALSQAADILPGTTNWNVTSNTPSPPIPPVVFSCASGTCPGSGSSGSGGGCPTACPCSGTVVVTISGLTGSCASINGSYTLTFVGIVGNVSNFQFDNGTIAIDYGCSDEEVGSGVLVTVAAGSFNVHVTGTYSPLDMSGSELIPAGQPCAGQIVSVTVT